MLSVRVSWSTVHPGRSADSRLSPACTSFELDIASYLEEEVSPEAFLRLLNEELYKDDVVQRSVLTVSNTRVFDFIVRGFVRFPSSIQRLWSQCAKQLRPRVNEEVRVDILVSSSLSLSVDRAVDLDAVVDRLVKLEIVVEQQRQDLAHLRKIAWGSNLREMVGDEGTNSGENDTDEQKGALLDVKANAGDSKPYSISFLWANPLVKKDSEKVTAFHDSFSSSAPETSAKVVKAIQNLSGYQPLKFWRSVFTMDNLQSVLQAKTTVLHVDCHGCYGDDGSFYLAVEGNAGQVEKLNTMTLQKIAAEFAGITLVFVSACHSYDVASTFRAAGVPVVVAVHSVFQVTESICDEFAKSFFSKLVSGQDIASAFHNTKKFLKEKSGMHQNGHPNQPKNHRACCCRHKHTDKCKSSHELHIPDDSCLCPFKWMAKHEPNCEWLEKFAATCELVEGIRGSELFNGKWLVFTSTSSDMCFSEVSKIIHGISSSSLLRGAGTMTRCVPVEHLSPLSHGNGEHYSVFFIQFSSAKFAKAVYLKHQDAGATESFTLMEPSVCCCRPDLPHDEASCFLILHSPTIDLTKTRLFENPSRSGKGKLVLFPRDPKLISNLPDWDEVVLDRDRSKVHAVVDRFLNPIANRRCRHVRLYGSEGIGKSTIARIVGRWVNLRRHTIDVFKNGVVYVDFREDYRSLYVGCNGSRKGKRKDDIVARHIALSLVNAMPERFRSASAVPENAHDCINLIVTLLGDFKLLLILDGVDLVDSSEPVQSEDTEEILAKVCKRAANIYILSLANAAVSSEVLRRHNPNQVVDDPQIEIKELGDADAWKLFSSGIVAKSQTCEVLQQDLDSSARGIPYSGATLSKYEDILRAQKGNPRRIALLVRDVLDRGDTLLESRVHSEASSSWATLDRELEWMFHNKEWHRRFVFFVILSNYPAGMVDSVVTSVWQAFWPMVKESKKPLPLTSQEKENLSVTAAESWKEEWMHEQKRSQKDRILYERDEGSCNLYGFVRVDCGNYVSYVVRTLCFKSQNHSWKNIYFFIDENLYYAFADMIYNCNRSLQMQSFTTDFGLLHTILQTTPWLLVPSVHPSVTDEVSPRSVEGPCLIPTPTAVSSSPSILSSAGLQASLSSSDASLPHYPSFGGCRAPPDSLFFYEKKEGKSDGTAKGDEDFNFVDNAAALLRCQFKSVEKALQMMFRQLRFLNQRAPDSPEHRQLWGHLGSNRLGERMRRKSVEEYHALTGTQTRQLPPHYGPFLQVMAFFAVNVAETFFAINEGHMDFYQRCLDVCRECNDKLGSLKVTVIIAGFCEIQNNLDEAVNQCGAGSRIASEIRAAPRLYRGGKEADNAQRQAVIREVKMIEGKIQNLYGDMHEKNKKFKDAIAKYETAQAVFRELGLPLDQYRAQKVGAKLKLELAGEAERDEMCIDLMSVATSFKVLKESCSAEILQLCQQYPLLAASNVQDYFPVHMASASAKQREGGWGGQGSSYGQGVGPREEGKSPPSKWVKAAQQGSVSDAGRTDEGGAMRVRLPFEVLNDLNKRIQTWYEATKERANCLMVMMDMAEKRKQWKKARDYCMEAQQELIDINDQVSRQRANKKEREFRKKLSMENADVIGTLIAFFWVDPLVTTAQRQKRADRFLRKPGPSGTGTNRGRKARGGRSRDVPSISIFAASVCPYAYLAKRADAPAEEERREALPVLPFDALTVSTPASVSEPMPSSFSYSSSTSSWLDGGKDARAPNLCALSEKRFDLDWAIIKDEVRLVDFPLSLVKSIGTLSAVVEAFRKGCQILHLSSLALPDASNLALESEDLHPGAGGLLKIVSAIDLEEAIGVGGSSNSAGGGSVAWEQATLVLVSLSFCMKINYTNYAMDALLEGGSMGHSRNWRMEMDGNAAEFKSFEPVLAVNDDVALTNASFCANALSEVDDGRSSDDDTDANEDGDFVNFTKERGMQMAKVFIEARSTSVIFPFIPDEEDGNDDDKATLQHENAPSTVPPPQSCRRKQGRWSRQAELNRRVTTFNRVFYENVLAKRTTSQAFQRARAAALSDDCGLRLDRNGSGLPRVALDFCLYPEEEDHDEVLFRGVLGRESFHRTLEDGGKDMRMTRQREGDNVNGETGTGGRAAEHGGVLSSANTATAIEEVGELSAFVHHPPLLLGLPGLPPGGGLRFSDSPFTSVSSTPIVGAASYLAACIPHPGDLLQESDTQGTSAIATAITGAVSHAVGELTQTSLGEPAPGAATSSLSSSISSTKTLRTLKVTTTTATATTTTTPIERNAAAPVASMKRRGSGNDTGKLFGMNPYVEDLSITSWAKHQLPPRPSFLLCREELIFAVCSDLVQVPRIGRPGQPSRETTAACGTTAAAGAGAGSGRGLLTTMGAGTRVVHIHGAACVGKTSVVVAAAYRLLERNCFPDGIVYLRVTKSVSMSNILSKLATVLSLPNAPSIRVVDDLRVHISDKLLLIVLDVDYAGDTEAVEGGTRGGSAYVVRSPSSDNISDWFAAAPAVVSACSAVGSQARPSFPSLSLSHSLSTSSDGLPDTSRSSGNSSNLESPGVSDGISHAGRASLDPSLTLERQASLYLSQTEQKEELQDALVQVLLFVKSILSMTKHTKVVVCSRQEEDFPFSRIDASYDATTLPVHNSMDTGEGNNSKSVTAGTFAPSLLDDLMMPTHVLGLSLKTREISDDETPDSPVHVPPKVPLAMFHPVTVSNANTVLSVHADADSPLSLFSSRPGPQWSKNAVFTSLCVTPLTAKDYTRLLLLLCKRPLTEEAISLGVPLSPRRRDKARSTVLPYEVVLGRLQRHPLMDEVVQNPNVLPVVARLLNEGKTVEEVCGQYLRSVGRRKASVDGAGSDDNSHYSTPSEAENWAKARSTAIPQRRPSIFPSRAYAEQQGGSGSQAYAQQYGGEAGVDDFAPGAMNDLLYSHRKEDFHRRNSRGSKTMKSLLQSGTRIVHSYHKRGSRAHMVTRTLPWKPGKVLTGENDDEVDSDDDDDNGDDDGVNDDDGEEGEEEVNDSGADNGDGQQIEEMGRGRDTAGAVSRRRRSPGPPSSSSPAARGRHNNNSNNNSHNNNNNKNKKLHRDSSNSSSAPSSSSAGIIVRRVSESRLPPASALKKLSDVSQKLLQKRADLLRRKEELLLHASSGGGHDIIKIDQRVDDIDRDLQRRMRPKVSSAKKGHSRRLDVDAALPTSTFKASSSPPRTKVDNKVSGIKPKRLSVGSQLVASNDNDEDADSTEDALPWEYQYDEFEAVRSKRISRRFGR